MSVEMNNNSESISEEIIKKEHIDNTPFEAVNYIGENWFLGFGKYRLPIYADSKKGLIEKMEEEKWNLIPIIVTIIIDNYKKEQDGN